MAFDAFAVTAPGLEPLAARELGGLGVRAPSVDTGGVAFAATESSLASTLLGLRTATRVLVRVAEFRAVSFAQLEKRAHAIPWDRWLSPGSRVRFRVTCRKSRLYHSDAVGERLAGSVSARITGVTVDAAPGDDEDGEAQLFVVRMANDICTVSVDASGAPLYQRGYRLAVAKAPMRETLAAAMLLGAGWTGDTSLYDPMCGSGTIVIEAALIARGIAPGIHRSFAAESWPTATRSAWDTARTVARDAERAAPEIRLCGSDRDEGAIAASRENAKRAGVSAETDFSVQAVSAVRAPAARGLLVTNPPYGVRVGDRDRIRDLYARFGRVARDAFPGWDVALLSADRTRGHMLERQLGLSLDEAWRSTNGGIPVRLLRSRTRIRTQGSDGRSKMRAARTSW